MTMTPEDHPSLLAAGLALLCGAFAAPASASVPGLELVTATTPGWSTSA